MIVICIYKFVLMCLCICVTLADFFTFLFTNKDPVSVYVVLYVIILIQILIRYNVKNLITACTRSLDFDLKIEKISLGWEGGHHPPRPSPRSGASLPRICYFSQSVPPQYVDPRYATESLYRESCDMTVLIFWKQNGVQILSIQITQVLTALE